MFVEIVLVYAIIKDKFIGICFSTQNYNYKIENSCVLRRFVSIFIIVFSI